jgi:carboxymethylenebutenolidase
MNAFLAVPAAGAPWPTVVLLHERYGLVQHSRDLAKRFAAAGHVAIVPNLYFRESDQEAVGRGEKRVPVSDGQACADMAVAVDALAEVPGADVTRLAVMGVCATGRYPLVLAGRGVDVAACVVFYGGVESRQWEVNDLQEEPLERLIAASSAPVLGVFGELDHIISVDSVLRFRSALDAVPRSYHIQIFRDAPHGWLNDTMPGRYRWAQADAAWQLLLRFLDRVHGGGFDASRVQRVFESDIASTYDFSKNVRLE